MISKEAEEIYIREELNFLKGEPVSNTLKDEAIAALISSNLFDEATEECAEKIQEYSKEVFSPLCNKLLYILKNKNNLKIEEKEEVNKLIESLKEKDKKFMVRILVLEDFFKSEEGSKLSEEDKIDLTLKIGALDFSFLKYFNKNGYLVLI